MVGSQYTWSAINVYYASYLHYYNSPKISITDVYFLMPSILFIQYITIQLGVQLEKKFKARATAVLSSGLILSSQILLFLTTRFWLVIIVMILSGIGNGIGFLSIVNNGWKYYPSKRGLVNGIILGGLGLSSAILNPIADFLIINPKRDSVLDNGFYSKDVADNMKTYFIFTISLFSVLTIIGSILTFPYVEPTVIYTNLIENDNEQTVEERNIDSLENNNKKEEPEDKKDFIKKALFSKQNLQLCIICFGTPCM